MDRDRRAGADPVHAVDVRGREAQRLARAQPRAGWRRESARRSSTSAPRATASAPFDSSWSWKPVSWSSPLQQMSQTSTRSSRQRQLDDALAGVVAHPGGPGAGRRGEVVDERAQPLGSSGSPATGRVGQDVRDDHAATSWGTAGAPGWRRARVGARLRRAPAAGRRPGGRSRARGRRRPRPRRHGADGRGAVRRRVEEHAAGRAARGSTPREASRSACSGARPASIAKQARRRGCAGRAQARERQPGGLHLGDVGRQRRPPRRVARPRGRGRCPRGRAGVHEERGAALLEQREEGRAARDALRAGEGERGQAQADAAPVELAASSAGSGSARLAAAQAPSAGGRSSAPAC